jgi:hypothetical protein
MALIKCPECKKEISNSAKNCPSCGYKISKGGIGCFTYLLIGLGILIFFYIIGSNSSGGNVIEDENTYSQSWRSPEGTEFRDIGRIMVKNNISGCGEYQVKEITDNEFVVACTPDGTNWTYYVVYPNLDKIYLANEEMEKKLKPPY